MKMLLNISNALKLFHSKGIAHKDINAGNILISKNDFTKIRLIDYGLSCYNDKCSDDIRYGTYQFFDPNVVKFIENKEDPCVDPHMDPLYIFQQGDLWSLGIIIYKIITDKYPLSSFKNNDDYFNNYSFQNDKNHKMVIDYVNDLNAIYNINLDMDNLLSLTEKRNYLFI